MAQRYAPPVSGETRAAGNRQPSAENMNTNSRHHHHHHFHHRRHHHCYWKDASTAVAYVAALAAAPWCTAEGTAPRRTGEVGKQGLKI